MKDKNKAVVSWSKLITIQHETEKFTLEIELFSDGIIITDSVGNKFNLKEDELNVLKSLFDGE